MGYELIPPQLPSPIVLLESLERGLELCNNDFSKCGQILRANGFINEGLFITRCYRSGIDANDLETLLLQMHNGGLKMINSLQLRLQTAWAIAKRGAEKKKKKIYGFKLNIPSIEKAFECFPNSSMLYILRDPRDVVASHIQRKFDRTIQEICKAWNNYIECFENFQIKYPRSGFVIHYEEIVSNSGYLLPKMFDFLSLPIDASVFDFFKSKAGVHTFGHPNAENLKKNFFTTSIGRWKNELSSEQVKQIVRLCGKKMFMHGYG
jgi:hypothetical protein